MPATFHPGQINDYARRYCLSVGVENYVDDAIGRLFYCAEDAQGVYEALKVADKVDQGQLLLDEQATRQNILGVLSGYLNQIRAGDLIIVFVSTHGTIEYDDYFFVPHDGRLDNILGSCISANLLLNALSEKIDEGVKALLILDTCHAGAMGFDLARYQGERGGGLSCLFSASAKDLSYEYVRLGHGLFSHYLIKGFEDSETNHPDGPITLRSLYNYVYKGVMEKSRMKQAPLLVGTLPGNTALKKPGPR